MASLRSAFSKTPGSWLAGKPYPDSTDVYMRGAAWSQPDTITPLNQGQAVFFARFGPGQVLGIGLGGVYAADAPPPPEEP